MDNFQLNNTSIYLSGQCKWDIILNKEGSGLKINGFQLTPVSNNIPFNKRGEVQQLNDYHSDTIKRFFEDIKENFWSTATSYSYYTDNNDKFCAYDPSFSAGIKRSPSYKLYQKQYSYFQPIWLENIENNNHLRATISINTNSGVVIGSRSVDFSIMNDNSFHDKFVNYFNNWLTYLNILPNPNRYHNSEYDNLGNNRVININFKESTATISGVSAETGQLVNDVNCDYIINNFLSYERSNMETDYLLTSLFSAHDIITSQLFNLNFCFNIEDIVEPFLINQLFGQKLYASCEISLIGTNNGIETKTVLDKRTLFNNYEYIKKSEYNPYLFVYDLDSLGNKTYKENFGETVSENVLDYLKDYENSQLETKNKLVPYIIHWGYTNHEEDTFNLYNGYQYIYDEFLDNNGDLRRSIDPDNHVTYTGDQKEIFYTNGVSIPYLVNDYDVGKGILSWLYPYSLLYMGYPGLSQLDITGKIQQLITNKGVTGLVYKNRLNQSRVENTWGAKGNTACPSNCAVAVIYLDGGYNISNINSLYPEKISSAHCVVGIETDGEDRVYVVYIDDIQNATLNKLISVIENSFDLTNPDASNLYNLLIYIKSVIMNGNDGSFYGFGTEIGYGKDLLGDNVYYKVDSKKTSVYRVDGNLSPSMIPDDEYKKNYEYKLNVDDQKIEKIESSVEESEDSGETPIDQPYELSVIGRSYIIDLAPVLEFEKEKNINDQTPLETLVKNYISEFYNVSSDQNLVDYIYKLYDLSFNYEYIENKIIYTIKLVLR